MSSRMTGMKIRRPLVNAFSLSLVMGAATLCPAVAMSDNYYDLDRKGMVTTEGSFKKLYRLDPSRFRVRTPHRELDQAIRWYARQHRLSPALLRAVIKAESDFNPGAVSPTGAIGLMQLMPRTAASLNIEDPFNPVENIRGGAKHLRYLLDRFAGNLPLAIAAYNAGEYRVKRHHYQIPPIQETRDYVEKVLLYYDAFKAKPKQSGMKGMY